MCGSSAWALDGNAGELQRHPQVSHRVLCFLSEPRRMGPLGHGSGIQVARVLPTRAVGVASALPAIANDREADWRPGCPRDEPIDLTNRMLLEVLRSERANTFEALPRSGAPRVPLQRGIRRNRMEQKGRGRDSELRKSKAMMGNDLSCLRFFSL